MFKQKQSFLKLRLGVPIYHKSLLVAEDVIPEPEDGSADGRKQGNVRASIDDNSFLRLSPAEKGGSFSEKVEALAIKICICVYA